MNKKQKRSGMKKSSLFLIVIIVILFTVGLAAVVYSYYNVLETRTIPYSFEVRAQKSMGMTKDTNQLAFGGAPPESAIARTIDFENTFGVDVRIKINKYGSNKDWLYVEPQEFYLSPGETKEVLFSLKIPSDAEIGLYKGEFKATFLRK